MNLDTEPTTISLSMRTSIARRRRFLRCSVLLLAVVSIVVIFDMLPSNFLPDPVPQRDANDRRVPIAILGDSDSHGFRDQLWWPTHKQLRGGAYRDATLQWTEVLEQLRKRQVDLGDFGTWGTRRRIMKILGLFGIDRRMPRKQDHQYNFAFGAAHCHDLSTGPFRQVPRLLDLMSHQPERWRNGVVIVRIGIVNLGGAHELEQMAQDPKALKLTQKIRACTAFIAEAIAQIRNQHAETRLVLVGILNNADCPPLWDRWQSGKEIANIDQALDQFDNTLRQLADRDPRITFFDDRAWFRARWGSRGPDGKPSYRAVAIGNTVQVTHSRGDAPTNSVLDDIHAGMVWNILWAQSMSMTLAQDLDLPIDPITDSEVKQFVASQLAQTHR